MSSKIEAEYIDIVKRNAWPIVYQKIGRESQTHPFTCIEAKKIQNKPLNRYRDVNPFDHSRIKLRRTEVDYINANLVQVARANRKYILTQGPLGFTVGHFWLMIWEQESRAILMLNKVIEKNEIKCHWYWPRGIGDQHKMTLDDVKLTVEQISGDERDYYAKRVFKLVDTESGEDREVIQFHYTTWPDFGVPASPNEFLEFLKMVRASGALEPNFGPLVVHCSAGIGRSGTFCLVDSCLVLIENDGPNSVDIQEVLLDLRRDRMGLIQTPDQLRFSYLAIIEGAKRLDPNWDPKAPGPSMLDSIYSVVPDEVQLEDAPPLPPPRLESRPPARPLPAIPGSVSMGDLNYPASANSSSDEDPPTPPPRRSSTPPISSAGEEEEDNSGLLYGKPTTETSALRQRRRRLLHERITAMKRRAKEAEKWHELKRSLYKPLTITFGVLIASIVIYAYVKH